LDYPRRGAATFEPTGSRQHKAESMHKAFEVDSFSMHAEEEAD
jgi:hypothetical protein